MFQRVIPIGGWLPPKPRNNHRMRRRAGFALVVMATTLASGPSLSQAREAGMSHDFLSTLPAGTQVLARSFPDIVAWAGDDHQAAFETFLVTCAPILDGKAALRDARPPTRGLIVACQAARHLAGGGTYDRLQVRHFFETHFSPFEIKPGEKPGFLTAYFEPEIEASLTPSSEFSVPVLARPADLVTLKQGEIIPNLAPNLAASRQIPAGLQTPARLVAYADRAAIWAGALHGQGLEIAWLRDEAELFITQVQGSARLRLTNGAKTRLVYAGRNGHPYTSIGKKMVEMGAMALEDMTLAKLMAWLRADPVRGRALMEQNRSYVFFALSDAPPEHGPIGGAGVPLTAGRSLAVDRTLWPYGMPVFIETAPLAPDGSRKTLDRLMIAQDTGSAITGPARGDFYMGSGDHAGEKAGLVRDAMRFIVLVPNEDIP